MGRSALWQVRRVNPSIMVLICNKNDRLGHGDMIPQRTPRCIEYFRDKKIGRSIQANGDENHSLVMDVILIQKKLVVDHRMC